MPEAKLVVLFAVVAITVVIGTAVASTYIVQPGVAPPTTSTPYCGPFGCDETTTTTHGASTTTVTTGSTFSTQSGYSGGLLVRLELNSSEIASGTTLGIYVSDYNPSSSALNLTKGTAWALNGLETGGCLSLYLPLGIAVFQGRYTSGNVSQGIPLRVFPFVACPMIVRYITGYLFQAMSDNATVLPGTRAVPMATGIAVDGAFDNTPNHLNQMAPFSPGIYTVVAGDEWGNLAFAYFVVSA